MSSSLRGQVFFTISLSPQKANAFHPRCYPSEYPVRIQCFVWGRLSHGKLRINVWPSKISHIHTQAHSHMTSNGLKITRCIFLNFYYFQFCVYVARWVCTRHCGYPGRPEVSDPQEMTLKAVVSKNFSTWVVGTKTRESITVNKEIN